MGNISEQATILVIDDEPDVAKYLERLFEDQGYRPLTATDGQQGLDLARQHTPGSSLRVQVLHSHNSEGAAMLRDEIDARFECTWLPEGHISLVLGAHTGPSMVGAAYQRIDYHRVRDAVDVEGRKATRSRLRNRHVVPLSRLEGVECVPVAAVTSGGINEIAELGTGRTSRHPETALAKRKMGRGRGGDDHLIDDPVRANPRRDGQVCRELERRHADEIVHPIEAESLSNLTRRESRSIL